MFTAINKKVVLAVSFGPGQTGKTVGYTLHNGDGTTFQARTTTGVSEVQSGSGLYAVEVAATVFSAAFDGYVLWDVAGSAPYATEDIFVSDRIDATVSSRLATSAYTAPDNADIAAIKAKTNLISGTNITLVSPVTEGGTVEIVQGDDYKATDGRALQWSSTSWPVLTSGSIELELRKGTLTASFAGSVLSATEAQVELTATDTEPLETGTWQYALKATLADGSVVTVAAGLFGVVAQP